MRLAAFIFALWLVAAHAVNTVETEFTCPIDATRWKQATETSSRVTAMRLDRREIGDVNDPRTLPQCPKCRFVMFISEWKDIEPLAERLRPFVLGADYQMIAAKRPTYFCLAQIQQYLKSPPLYTGQSYLRAAWQVEENEMLTQRYLALALAQFTTATASMNPADKDRPNILLLSGEIERRLAQWDTAEKRFRDYQSTEPFSAPAYQAVIALQLRLIAAKDNKPHLLEGRPSASPEKANFSISGAPAAKEAPLLPDPTPISIKPPPKPKPKLFGSP